MSMSEIEQTEFDELVSIRQRKRAALDKAAREYEAAGLEVRAFLAERGVASGTTTDGYRAEVMQVVDWRHLDAELVEKDFPRGEYPDIYTPEYQMLKTAVNMRVNAKNPDSTAAVSKYTGFVQQLRVRRVQKRNVYRRSAR